MDILRTRNLEKVLWRGTDAGKSAGRRYPFDQGRGVPDDCRNLGKRKIHASSYAGRPGHSDLRRNYRRRQGYFRHGEGRTYDFQKKKDRICLEERSDLSFRIIICCRS